MRRVSSSELLSGAPESVGSPAEAWHRGGELRAMVMGYCEDERRERERRESDSMKEGAME